MKIYFCDICNESIPLEDLQDSSATTIKGKIFCSACNPVKVTPTAAVPAASSVLPLALFALAILVAGAAGVHSLLMAERLAQLPRYDGPIAELRTQTNANASETSSLHAAREQQAKGLEELHGSLATVRQSGADQGQRLDQIEQGVRELHTLLENMRSTRESIHKLSITQSQVQASMSELRVAVATLEERMSSLSTGPLVGISREAPGGADEDEPAAEFDEETRRFLADLKSKDASVRWTGVDRLSQLRDRRLIPYLTELLDDNDAFVQFRVISALRELNARSAVGRLIALLRDADAIVREEALEALITLTGHADRFDVTSGSRAEREAGVLAWEKWFKENRDRFSEEM